MALISDGLITVKLFAAIPPKVTFVAPLKSDPRIVTGVGLTSGPPVGLSPVIDGTPWPLLFSLTYSIVLAGPGSVD